MHPATITTDPDKLPPTPGAYLLLIRLDRIIDLPAVFKGLQLSEGHYAYAGSAYGPGGIRARCRRHLGRSGARHWHVDWLTHESSDVQAAAFPGETECALIERLAPQPGVQVPLPGFGSSDCPRCEAHLLNVAAQESVLAFCQTDSSRR